MGLFSFLFGSFDTPPDAQRPIRRDAVPSQIVRLAGDGGFDVEVVGESFRQDALNAICGGKCEDGHDHDCVALLQPEPSNPHDPNAVRVMISGQHVAYLAREDAKRFNDQMERLGLKGRTAECEAVINGGWSRPRKGGRVDEGDYGVELDLVWPLEVEQ